MTWRQRGFVIVCMVIVTALSIAQIADQGFSGWDTASIVFAVLVIGVLLGAAGPRRNA